MIPRKRGEKGDKLQDRNRGLVRSCQETFKHKQLSFKFKLLEILAVQFLAPFTQILNEVYLYQLHVSDTIRI